MRKSNRPFLPANDYNEINSLLSFAGMNGRFDLHIITQPHSEVYCGYFRRLVFGNSLTFSLIPPCFHAKPPDFPRLIGPRAILYLHVHSETHGSSRFRCPLHAN